MEDPSLNTVSLRIRSAPQRLRETSPPGDAAVQAAREETTQLVSVSGAGRLPELDGFRALAIWMVLIHHAFYGFARPDGALAWAPPLLMEIIFRGWLGVDLFFVLSGLLITGILLDSKGRPRYFRNFYSRRILRIVPVYFTVVGVMWLFYSGYSHFFLLSLGFLANFAGYFQAPVPHAGSVFWSLAIEEHFYLLWPLVVLLLNRRQLFVFTASIVVLVPVLRGLGAAVGMDIEAAIYQYSWFRFDGLALGALLALWLRSPLCTVRRTLLLALCLLAASLLVTVAGAPFGLLQTKSVMAAALRYTQVQLVFAAAIIASLAKQGSRVTAPLRSQGARWSADLSYCIYLIHLGVGHLYESSLSRLDIPVEIWAGPSGAVLLRAAAIVAGSFALAALSKRFLEDPFLRLKRYFV